MLSTVVEIEATPAHVRDILTKFEAYPMWHGGQLFTEVTVLAAGPDNKLIKGARLLIETKKDQYEVQISENSPEAFTWRTVTPSMTITTVHSFRYNPSRRRAGYTTLVHQEGWAGRLAFVKHAIQPLCRSRKKAFVKFDTDLKAKVEDMYPTAAKRATMGVGGPPDVNLDTRPKLFG